ncbi:MAG: hypothetical protein N2Z40_02400 [Caldimicrobium sp.]|nr:hypothetical protein [Caldimicrobium sp.]MCX7613061.1 hypothetical protein [Caldimicrobium sp.]MDW8182788.1 hypothetical protein [Caldimicrobium sp.]
MKNYDLDAIMTYLNREEDRYVKILKKHYRARRVERDTFFSSKDRNILIESFVIGGLLEKAAEKIISRIF